MHTVTRRLEFDAAHRVLGHEGKCKNLHGHRYVAEITVSVCSRSQIGLDPVGRVIDFSVIKTKIGGWIDYHWDHNLLLNSADTIAMLPLAAQINIMGDKAPYIFEKCNPTAENIAEKLFGVCHQLLSVDGLAIERVRIYETPNCWADYTGNR